MTLMAWKLSPPSVHVAAITLPEVLWFRELELAGSYATAGDDFADAMALAGGSALDGVLSATYPLVRWREALDHALSAGRLGAVKIAFDPGAAG